MVSSAPARRHFGQQTGNQSLLLTMEAAERKKKWYNATGNEEQAGEIPFQVVLPTLRDIYVKMHERLSADSLGLPVSFLSTWIISNLLQDPCCLCLWQQLRAAEIQRLGGVLAHVFFWQMHAQVLTAFCKLHLTVSTFSTSSTDTQMPGRQPCWFTAALQNINATEVVKFQLGNMRNDALCSPRMTWALSFFFALGKSGRNRVAHFFRFCGARAEAQTTCSFLEVTVTLSCKPPVIGYAQQTSCFIWKAYQTST